jgi:hypothetical protein
MGIRSLRTASISTGVKRSKVWDQSAVVLTGAFEPIATAFGTGSNQVFTFSSIPQGYKHLQIRASLVTSGLGGTPTQYGGWVTVNGDTGSNYTDHTVYGDGASAAAYSSVPRANTGIINYSTNGTYSASNIVDLLEYSSTNRFKTFRSFLGGDSNGNGFIALSSGLWRNTSAITSISLHLNAGFGGHNFTTDARVSLYGIKGN